MAFRIEEERPSANGLFSFEELSVLERLPASQRNSIMTARVREVEDAIAKSKRVSLVALPPVAVIHSLRGLDWEQVRHEAVHEYAHRHFADPRQKEMLNV